MEKRTRSGEQNEPDAGTRGFSTVPRDSGSGEMLPARNLLGATEDDLVPLLAEVAALCQAVEVLIVGVISHEQCPSAKRGVACPRVCS
jgi:hypothetical protein